MIDPILDRTLSRRRRWKHAIWLFARIFVMPALFVTIRLRSRGLKHMPRSGGVILVSNHVDFFDPVVIDAASPRPVLWMAKTEVFSYPVLQWIAVQAGAFPVERGKPDRSALRHAAALLDEGLVVGLFPEGTRSRSGGLKEPFAGASMVAVRSGKPVVPCAIVGSDGLPLSGFPAYRPGRYPKVEVLFGEPFLLAHQKCDGTRWSLEEMTDALMIEIARLLPPPYRGIYAERAGEPHPAVRKIGVPTLDA